MTVQVLPEEWLAEDLPKLYREQHELVQPLFRTLLAENAELRWSLVVRAYQDHRINLGKAAEILGLHELELRDRFIELGISLRIGPADLAEARAEVAAVHAWYAHPAGDPTP